MYVFQQEVRALYLGGVYLLSLLRGLRKVYVCSLSAKRVCGLVFVFWGSAKHSRIIRRSHGGCGQEKSTRVLNPCVIPSMKSSNNLPFNQHYFSCRILKRPSLKRSSDSGANRPRSKSGSRIRRIGSKSVVGRVVLVGLQWWAQERRLWFPPHQWVRRKAPPPLTPPSLLVFRFNFYFPSAI